jgi:hypothetical protein
MMHHTANRPGKDSDADEKKVFQENKRRRRREADFFVAALPMHSAF